MSLVSELRRRNVLRMAVLYVVAAWLIMQVAEVVITLAGFPGWLGQAVLSVLAIGFPIALIFSWFYELTPEGLVLEKDVRPGKSITHITGRRLDLVVIAVLCAALIIFAYDKWWTTGPPVQSVAVLPFVNMSGDPDQEYFSDGISEEVINLLNRVQGLRVVARTSSFSFKDQHLDTQKIAEVLGVRHLIQGSVRQSGAEVRVSAQLVDAADGTTVWSETHERALEDVFSVQDEIAASIALALELAVSDELLKSTKVDPEAYKQLLRSRHLIYRGSVDDSEAALEAAKLAVAIAPQYAEAWAQLSLGYAHMAFSGDWPREKALGLLFEAVEKALEIDPQNVVAHSRIAQFHTLHSGDLALAADHVNRAIVIDADNLHTLASAAHLALELGRSDEAIALWKRIVTYDPVAPLVHANLCRAQYYSSQFDEALNSCRFALALSPEHWVNRRLLPAARWLAEGFDSIEQAEQERYDLSFLVALYEHGEMARFDREFAGHRVQNEETEPERVAYVYAYLGMKDDAFEWLDKVPSGLTENKLFHMSPLLKPLHDDPRWHDFLVRMNRTPEELDKIELNIPLEIVVD